MRQAAASALGTQLRLCRIDRARFARPLFEGDALELSLRVTPARTRAWWRCGPAGCGPTGSWRRNSPSRWGRRWTMLDHAQVRARLRQRPPMLLLDTVREFSPPDALVATKAVTGGEDCYRDMAPGAGIGGFAYPAVLLLESFGQAVSLLWSLAELGPAEEVPLMVGIRGLVYGAPALPGDVLEHHVRLSHHSGGVGEFTGQTRTARGGTVVSVGSMLVVSRPSHTLLPSPTVSV
ncbi:hypothetical protein O1L60_00460 [Streptomyces diastatochromogenes]|nr:hypothetical protein [Streptomyces diastatochromogenes]